jgi:hypothetical protein
MLGTYRCQLTADCSGHHRCAMTSHGVGCTSEKTVGNVEFSSLICPYSVTSINNETRSIDRMTVFYGTEAWSENFCAKNSTKVEGHWLSVWENMFHIYNQYHLLVDGRDSVVRNVVTVIVTGVDRMIDETPFFVSNRSFIIVSVVFQTWVFSIV